MTHDTLTHLANLERLRHDPAIDYSEEQLDELTPEDAAILVSMLPKPAPVVQRAPVDPVVRAKPLRRASLHPVVKYKATMWYQGRTVALGWFLTQQVRDEAVTLAKSMRAIGLPLESIRDAVRRMK